MRRNRPSWTWTGTALAVSMLMTGSWVEAAAPAQAASGAASATSPAQAGKDIVLDQPATAGAASPAPAGTASAGLVPRPSSETASMVLPTAPSHQAAVAGHVAELGLNLVRDGSKRGANSVVSPTSVSVALAMLSAGTTQPSAREIQQLFGGGRMGATLLSHHLGHVLQQATAGTTEATPAALKMASRLWVRQASSSKLQPAYLKGLDERLRASVASLDFGAAEPARRSINEWVSKGTGGLITEVLPPGAVGTNTHMVLTQATHFRSPWAQGFNPAATQMLSFHMDDGSVRSVPTLLGDMKVRSGKVGGWELLELPFRYGDMAVLIAMPPQTSGLLAALKTLDGLDLTGWGAALQPHSCQVQLPKLALKPATRSLKLPLQALGVQRVFSASASFAPAMGKAGENLQLDDVFHAASLTLDEQGGEAAAATAAVVGVKSLNPAQPPKRCVIDRPFVLVLIHKPSSLPLFIARVQDPSQP
jgi:serpin B